METNKLTIEEIKAHNFKNITGLRYGMLTVIKPIGKNKWGNIIWQCKCDCGNLTNAKEGDLHNKHKISCGCFKNNNLGNITRKHGYTQDKSKVRLYNIWQIMKSRCYNPKNVVYEIYGKRGITVCDEWKNSFICFKDWALTNGYKSTLTIDRIDYNGNYTPFNCRWATPKEQANNKRNNRYLTLNGITHTAMEWIDILSLKASTVYSRLERGLPIEIVLNPNKYDKNKFKI